MENLELKKLIISNQNLIYSIASKFRGDMEDLFQVGCIGLINAYKNYDERFETKFTTYAYPYIFGEIYKYVLQNKNIKINQDMAKLSMAISKAHDFLCQQYNREPTDIELSNFLEVPINKLAEVRNSMEVISLDDDRKDIDLYNFIPSELINEDLILLKDAIAKLQKDERDLILKRYFYNMTQSEIAELLGINQVKVSREESRVLSKLRSYM